MLKSKNKFAVVGAIASLLAATIKTRHLIGIEETAEPASGRQFNFSRGDWKRVLIGIKDALGKKHLPALAAGVAYYATLAFFPFLAATVAVSALLISPDQLEALMTAARTYLPEDISRIIASQLENLVSRRADNFLAASIATVVALYGASGVSKSLITAGNAVYSSKETRGWLLQQLTGIAWTGAGIVLGLVVLGLMALNRSLLVSANIPEEIISTLLAGRWVVVLVLTISGIAVFYRQGPSRRRARWRWVLFSASLTTLVWLAATSLFFWYLQNIANFTQSYSLFAGIIALMVWMNLSALILLIGAELNHQIEAVEQGEVT